MKKRYLTFVMSVLMLLTSGCSHKTEEKIDTGDIKLIVEEPVEEEAKEEIVMVPQEVEESVEPEKEVVVRDIVISAVGDCTLGTDTNFGYENSFTNVLDDHNRDFSYFFKEVQDVIGNDDLTIVNLETTFTNSNNRVDKKFNFKGDADYASILTEGSIEAVNLANNHTYDYGSTGYHDTIAALNEVGVPYFGYEDYVVLEFDGIEVGLAGVTGWDEASAKANTDKAIEYFHRNNIDLIIMTYHWGIERDYDQNATQQNIARYAIEQGAHLVIGHHPHVLQGIECYQGKYIIYSLGNFVFGGNKNPGDKDTMIFQQTFHYEDGYLIDTSIEIVPCSLSGESTRNNYQPVLLEGEEKERVLQKVLDHSTNFEYEK